MTTENQTCVIIGASHAGASLATAVRKEGWEGKIVVLGDESAMPYHRPPLSKALLNGEKQANEIDIFKATVYEKANVEFQLGVHVESLDRSAKELTLTSGDKISYDKLALCTGARVRKLPIPGAELAGVHYLRTLDDALAIKAEVKEGNKAVIVGGGYIGLETAASLRKLGMEVTVLEMMNRVLERVTAPELSDYYTQLHESHGVKIITEAQAQEIKGDGKAQQVVCNNDLTLDADMVIIGIGVIPNTELAEQAGLAVDNGVVVNELAATEDPDIVAAGDCTNHPNDLLGFNLRLESVPNATEQARTAAASICGNAKPYHSMPWFWSDQYDIKLQISGFNKGYDRVVLRGEPSSNSFVAWYLKGSEILAADCINASKEFMQAKKIIAQKLPLTEAQLADASNDLKTLVAEATS
ncbi:MAG: FAD-dependent oxidoreductase [Pseudomonadales bacterium]|nr:FAD-dependent oxidoreductase [Pseudomonadales bacterium]